MDTIEKIEIFETKVPLAKPLSVGFAKITHRGYTVVQVTTAANIRGIGYCYSRGFPMGEIIKSVMSPIAIGSSAEAPDELRSKILGFNWQSAEHGTFTAALSALDLALHDIQAKRLGVSVASMLGGNVSSIPVYSVIGYNYGEDDSSLLEEIDFALGRGIQSFKIIAGGASPERDAQRIQLLRKTVGDGVHIGVDAFRTFRTLENAVNRVNLIRDFDIDFIEDPFLESEGILAAALRDATGVPISYGESLASSKMVAQILDHNECVPISYGESLASSKMVAQILDHDECDLLRLDALVIGGVTEFITAASLAAKKGKMFSTHIHSEIHSQLAAATPNLYVGGLEYLDPIYEIDLFHHLLVKPIEIRDGAAILSTAPGFGIDWDWDAIHHFAQ
ncbi:MAG: hypothetical protein NTX12_02085 [Actinobacteria bacterium]|nr:hypothetical protein [Actinomycetota bacterium]